MEYGTRDRLSTQKIYAHERSRLRGRGCRCSTSVLFAIVACSAFAQYADLALVRGFRSNVTITLSDLSQRSLEYARMPVDLAQDLNFSAHVQNIGSDTATNVTVSVEVLMSGTAQGVFDSATLPMLPPGEGDTLVIDAGWNASTEGDVLLVFTIDSDQVDTVTGNNVDSAWINVNTYEHYSRTAGTWTTTAGGYYQWSMVGTRYEAVIDQMVCAVTCVIPNTTDMVGSAVVGYLLDDDFNTIVSSEEYFVLPNDLSDPGEEKQIVLLIGFEQLSAGNDYYAAVEMYGNDTVAIGATDTGPDTSIFSIDPDTWNFEYIPVIPMVGLVYRYWCVGGNEEVHAPDVQLLLNRPNPCSENTSIDLDLTSAVKIQLDLRNANGALIRSIELGMTPPGHHSVDLDVRNLPNGIYSYSITTDKAILSRRMVVLR